MNMPSQKNQNCVPSCPVAKIVCEAGWASIAIQGAKKLSRKDAGVYAASCRLWARVEAMPVEVPDHTTELGTNLRQVQSGGPVRAGTGEGAGDRAGDHAGEGMDRVRRSGLVLGWVREEDLDLRRAVFCCCCTIGLSPCRLWAGMSRRCQVNARTHDRAWKRPQTIAVRRSGG